MQSTGGLGAPWSAHRRASACRGRGGNQFGCRKRDRGSGTLSRRAYSPSPRVRTPRASATPRTHPSPCLYHRPDNCPPDANPSLHRRSLPPVRRSPPSHRTRTRRGTLDGDARATAKRNRSTGARDGNHAASCRVSAADTPAEQTIPTTSISRIPPAATAPPRTRGGEDWRGEMTRWATQLAGRRFIPTMSCGRPSGDDSSLQRRVRHSLREGGPTAAGGCARC